MTTAIIIRNAEFGDFLFEGILPQGHADVRGELDLT